MRVACASPATNTCAISERRIGLHRYMLAFRRAISRIYHSSRNGLSFLCTRRIAILSIRFFVVSGAYHDTHGRRAWPRSAVARRATSWSSVDRDDLDVIVTAGFQVVGLPGSPHYVVDAISPLHTALYITTLIRAATPASAPDGYRPVASRAAQYRISGSPIDAAH